MSAPGIQDARRRSLRWLGAVGAMTVLLAGAACSGKGAGAAGTTGAGSQSSGAAGQAASPAQPAGSAAQSPGGSDGKLTTVRLVNTKYGAELLPVTAGLANGTFKKHGIDLQVTTANTSSVATSALVSGRADLGLLQAAFVVSADAAGAKLVMVGSVLDELDYHIITAKGIKSLDQLAGKKMGDPGPNNGNTATMKAALDAAGIGSQKLTYVTVGAQAPILAALEANQVQVGLLVAPFTIQARAAGLNDLGTVVKYLPHNTAAVIAGLSTTLQKQPDVVRNFMAALIESTQWVAQNQAAALKILESADKMTPDIAQQSYNEVKDFYTKDGAIDPTGLQTWVQVALKYGVMNKSVSVNDVYTAQYLPGH